VQIRSILQSKGLPPGVTECSKATEELSSPIDNARGELILQQKFKPKFGPLQVKNRSIQYSAVVITQVIHPYRIYVRFEDQDFPLYRQMMEDLQLEFGQATKESHSYCPTPVEGKIFVILIYSFFINLFIISFVVVFFSSFE